ncbi:B-cell receptor-associated protein 31-like [Clytia hemisphaerica]|uniref:Endoplasmic reticulum transmembrane protein n=1 Tax=Clytia hemisphaerica TaxID=252671 RepID=A0A7M5WJQ1_9CNID|eukprot:TCONS_00007998-protein
MSLQWLSAAAFLYAEVGIGVLLCLDFISNARWQSIFTSRLLAIIKQYGNFIFNSFVFFMLILFIESIHKAHKFSNIKFDNNLANNPQAEVQAHMKLFRAQRNLYITGFALFMLLVLRRLVTLISKQATLEASHAAAIKQAQGASEQAQKLLEENEKLSKGKRRDANEENEQKENMENHIDILKKELKDKKDKLEKAEKDLTAMKQQSENLTTEYNRMADERNAMEKKLRILGESAASVGDDDSSKKDD